jgi:MerR family mercuric resistance operon transcriptional regulator
MDPRRGYRRYGVEHLKRLTFIRWARDLAFTLAAVRTLLTLADGRRRSCAEARAIGVQHLEDVRGKIDDLQAIERVLRQVVTRCADGTLPDCPLIDALAGGPQPKRQSAVR